MTESEDDLVSRNQQIIAMSISMARAYWETNRPPPNLMADSTQAIPLALYLAIKYQQSLPKKERMKFEEEEMKQILLSHFPDFVKEALATDPKPPILA